MNRAIDPQKEAQASADFLALLRGHLKGLAGWSIEQDAGRGEWIELRHRGVTIPRQGWKLHVSAGLSSAESVLSRALPVLFAEPTRFKVAASRAALQRLNQGIPGAASQIGKFITVYPVDDAQALRLAAALDRATAGLRGPKIPSDRPLREGSLVHYRHGSFANELMQQPDGRYVPFLRTPDGALIPDERRERYEAPDWVEDPFLAAGVAGPLSVEPPRRVIAGRYLSVAVLARSARGAVILAIDLPEKRCCVLKTARRDALLGGDGRDAVDALRRETAVLRELPKSPFWPEVYRLVEERDQAILVLEDVEGKSLEEHISSLASAGRTLGDAQLIAWGTAIARALAAMHAQGFVHRDIKLGNILLTPDGRLRLIDFELCQKLDDRERPYGIGTAGFMSPAQERGERPSVQDDVFALGAVLYALASGANPAYGTSRRPVELLSPWLGLGLASVIARCLAPLESERFPSMDAVVEALERLRPDAESLNTLAPSKAPTASPARRLHYSDLCKRTLAAVRDAARLTATGAGLAWKTDYLGGSGLAARDLGAGSAGPVLVLAEALPVMPEFEATLRAGAQGLVEAKRYAGEPVSGLFVGDAGVGLALLRAGQSLEDHDFVRAAADLGRQIAARPHRAPDLYNGSAGRLWLHLHLWDATGDREHLDAARAAGDYLLAAALNDERGARWAAPAGAANHIVYLGYAHGAAGIGDALLALHEATGEIGYLDAARAAARWIAAQALPALDDGSGLGFPLKEGESVCFPYWCHGATGITRFFLRGVDRFTDAAEIIERASKAIAASARFAGAAQCHGVTGSIELLLDAHAATGHAVHLDRAFELATVMESLARPKGDRLEWAGAQPDRSGPEYTVGWSGVAACLLRLASPDERLHLFARKNPRAVAP